MCWILGLFVVWGLLHFEGLRLGQVLGLGCLKDLFAEAKELEHGSVMHWLIFP